jgi:hypothetical protein
VLTVWECTLRSKTRREAAVARLVRGIVRGSVIRTASVDSARAFSSSKTATRQRLADSKTDGIVLSDAVPNR